MLEIDKNLPKEQRILLAAEDVFSRHGYVQATLDEIIALADTGKGTIYKYFGSKDKLFYRLVSGKINPFLERLRVVATSDKTTPEKIHDYMLQLLSFLKVNKDLYRILWYEVSGNQRGIHPMILNDCSWERGAFYGQALSAEEYERNRRYRDLIREQVQCLVLIIKEGMDSGFMKMGEPAITAHHLFGGVAMSTLHYVGQQDLTDEELADLIVDRFLYGHAVKEV